MKKFKLVNTKTGKDINAGDSVTFQWRLDDQSYAAKVHRISGDVVYLVFDGHEEKTPQTYPADHIGCEFVEDRNGENT